MGAGSPGAVGVLNEVDCRGGGGVAEIPAPSGDLLAAGVLGGVGRAAPCRKLAPPPGSAPLCGVVPPFVSVGGVGEENFQN